MDRRVIVELRDRLPQKKTASAASNRRGRRT